MIRYFAGHPTAANVLMLAVFVLGLVALPKLQRDTFPVIPATEVEVRVAYPGATPADVEDGVCQRLEEALDTVMALNEIRCDARENLAIATVRMDEGADMDQFFTDVKAQVDSIVTFPEKAEKPSVVKLERTANVASIAITGDMSPDGLKAYADRVKERIKRDKRIAQVRVLGFSDRDITVEIPAEALLRYGLGVADVAAAIARQSIDLPAGTMETDDGDVIVRFAGQRRLPADFADLVVVSGDAGGRVLLSDIAQVTTRFDRPEEKVLFNGQRAALIEISKTLDQDSLAVMAAIQENLKREKAMAPRGVSLTVSQDSTSNIRDRLRLVFVNGLQGLALVFLVMWAFFSFRFSFWVAMGLPVSFLGAVFVMNALGYTLNMMTMVGLLVAIGLLMDDAIIISENVAAKLKRGLKPLEATVQGTREVLPGVLSSFLTTILIVGPLAFMAGRMGAVLRYLPAILVITLAVSLIEAFLILPAHLRHSLDGIAEDRRSRFRIWFDSRFEWGRERLFGPLIDGAIRFPYLSVGVLVGLVLLSYAAVSSGLLKFQAFPSLDSDIVQARILLPQGTPLARTEEVAAIVENALKQVDEEFSAQEVKGQKLVRNVSILFNTNADAYESGPHLATVSADLLRAEHRRTTIDELLGRWRELVGEVPDVVFLKFTDRERGVAGKAIDIRLMGNNLQMLKKASYEMQQWLAGFRGVQDLADDLRLGKPEYRVVLQERAGTLGVTGRMVADELRAAVHGGTNLEVQLGQEAYDVTVRLTGADRNGLEDLQYLPIPTAGGQLVPLSAVATIEEDRGHARIHRVNGTRTVTVQGTIDTTIVNARELMQVTKKKFVPELRQRYPGMRVGFVGQGRESAITGGSLRNNLLVGVAGIFLLLAFQFRSFVQPIAVIMAIPMGLIGSVVGHLLLGLDLTMPSLVGLATLAGIVVNDNILLVGFIKQRLDEGESVPEAARQAARDRFRAIVLTSLTTIAGLLPILTETSTQAQFLIPMIASLTFGLFTATVLSLILVPAFFTIFGDLGWLGKRSAAMQQAPLT